MHNENKNEPGNEFLINQQIPFCGCLTTEVSHSLMFTLRSRPIAQLSVGALGLYGISFAAIEIFEILEHLEYFQRADSWQHLYQSISFPPQKS